RQRAVYVDESLPARRLLFRGHEGADGRVAGIPLQRQDGIGAGGARAVAAGLSAGRSAVADLGRSSASPLTCAGHEEALLLGLLLALFSLHEGPLAGGLLLWLLILLPLNGHRGAGRAQSRGGRRVRRRSAHHPLRVDRSLPLEAVRRVADPDAPRRRGAVHGAAALLDHVG